MIEWIVRHIDVSLEVLLQASCELWALRTWEWHAAVEDGRAEVEEDVPAAAHADNRLTDRIRKYQPELPLSCEL